MEAFVSKDQFVSFFSFFQLFQNETLPETFSPSTFTLLDGSAKKDMVLLGTFYHQFQKKARINSSSYYYWKLLELQSL